MYCRNCGNEMHENAAICVKCGLPKGKGDSYCPNCASETANGAVVCLKCGVSLKQGGNGAGKSKMVAGLLGILLGGFGAHNFYLGYTGKAILQIITSFFFGAGYIWGIIEGVMILTGKINKDAKGNPLIDS